MAGGAGRRARITATPAAAEQDLATRRREAGKAWIGGAGLRRIIRQDRSTAGIGSQNDGRRDKNRCGDDGRQHRQEFTLRISGTEGRDRRHPSPVLRRRPLYMTVTQAKWAKQNPRDDP